MSLLLWYALLVILLATPFRLLVGYCATVRGRHPLAWSLLTYVLGPFALIVAALPTQEDEPPQAHPLGHAALYEAVGTLGMVMLVVTLYGLGWHMLPALHDALSAPPTTHAPAGTPPRAPEPPLTPEQRRADEAVRKLRQQQGTP